MRLSSFSSRSNNCCRVVFKEHYNCKTLCRTWHLVMKTTLPIRCFRHTSSSYPSVFWLVGSFPSGIVASYSFHCCVSGDLL
jgi:hypothetical protein